MEQEVSLPKSTLYENNLNELGDNKQIWPTINEWKNQQHKHHPYFKMTTYCKWEEIWYKQMMIICNSVNNVSGILCPFSNNKTNHWYQHSEQKLFTIDWVELTGWISRSDGQSRTSSQQWTTSQQIIIIASKALTCKTKEERNN